MKTSVIALCFVACSAWLLADTPSSQAVSTRPAPLIEELVRMTRAGASDASVLAYARAHRLELPPELSDADLRWLAESGVSPRVVSYMSAIDVRASDPQPQEQPQEETGSVPPQAYGNEPEGETVPVNPSDQYANGASNVYPETYADSSYGAPDYYDSYPWYGDWPYPYAYFAIANPFFFADFCGHHGHHHHGNNHHHVDHHNDGHGSHGSSVAQGSLRDAWRQRTPAQGRNSSLAASRGPSRTVAPRGGTGFSYGRSSGRMVARGGFSRGPARAVSPRGVPSSRSFARPGGFSRPAFSSFSRGPGFGGGSRGAAPRAAMGSFGGSSGGRGRR